MTDGAGSIAITTGAYELAQNVACAVRLFLGEQYYQQDMGVPYDTILGKQVPLSYVSAAIEKQALTVVGVVKARCIIDDLSNRQLRGRIVFTDETGLEHGVNF